MSRPEILVRTRSLATMSWLRTLICMNTSAPCIQKQHVRACTMTCSHAGQQGPSRLCPVEIQSSQPTTMQVAPVPM